jgi:chromosome partitioning protein
MGRVITVANQKGGVGKTSTVANLGAALSQRGLDVLLIDADPQAALTASAGFDPYSIKPTTYSLLLDRNTGLEKVAVVLDHHLWLAPASVDLAAAEYQLSGATDRTGRLAQALQPARERVDYILIDTPPNIGLLTVNALVAADELLIPVECHYLALRGVRALLETVWLLREQLEISIRLLGLLATMVDRRSQHCLGVIDELRRVFAARVFETVIDYDESVAAAPAARKSVLAFRPEGQAALAYVRLADEIDQRVGVETRPPARSAAS